MRILTGEKNGALTNKLISIIDERRLLRKSAVCVAPTRLAETNTTPTLEQKWSFTLACKANDDLAHDLQTVCSGNVMRSLCEFLFPLL